MKILLATDGSESARFASRFLERFPFPKESTITVVTVIDEEFFNPEAAGPLEEEQRQLLRDTEKAVREEGERHLEIEADRLRKTGWECRTMVRSGSPAQEVVRAAEKVGAELIVIGSKGITGVSRFLMGSVSHQVMEYAPCSVLIVKHPEEGRDEEDQIAEGKAWRILLAFDDSAPSRKAVEVCSSLPLGANAEVTALTVMPMVKMYRQDIRQELNTIWQKKEHAAHEALDTAIKGAHWSTPKVSGQMRESADASHGILEAAEELNSDLIILGHKGKRAIQRFLLGSVTHHVSRHADCAVWVVRD